jgi:hypothetical protein
VRSVVFKRVSSHIRLEDGAAKLWAFPELSVDGGQKNPGAVAARSFGSVDSHIGPGKDGDGGFAWSGKPVKALSALEWSLTIWLIYSSRPEYYG